MRKKRGKDRSIKLKAGRERISAADGEKKRSGPAAVENARKSRGWFKPVWLPAACLTTEKQTWRWPVRTSQRESSCMWRTKRERPVMYASVATGRRFTHHVKMMLSPAFRSLPSSRNGFQNIVTLPNNKIFRMNSLENLKFTIFRIKTWQCREFIKFYQSQRIESTTVIHAAQFNYFAAHLHRSKHRV